MKISDLPMDPCPRYLKDIELRIDVRDRAFDPINRDAIIQFRKFYVGASQWTDWMDLEVNK